MGSRLISLISSILPDTPHSRCQRSMNIRSWTQIGQRTVPSPQTSASISRLQQRKRKKSRRSSQAGKTMSLLWMVSRISKILRNQIPPLRSLPSSSCPTHFTLARTLLRSLPTLDPRHHPLTPWQLLTRDRPRNTSATPSRSLSPFLWQHPDPPPLPPPLVSQAAIQFNIFVRQRSKDSNLIVMNLPPVSFFPPHPAPFPLP
jgi:hypothetical protein